MSAFGNDSTLTMTLIFAVVFVALSAMILRPQRRTWRKPQSGERSRYPRRPIVRTSFDAHQSEAGLGSNLSDPAEQLRAVMAGTFTAKRVLSRTEANVLKAAEQAIAEAGLGWRVMAQVALGEVLASPDEAAFKAINAKRVDLLVVSAKSEPLAAIEYQGEGHWQGSAPARDAVKKEALRKAGVGYIEITPAHGPADVRREIGRLAFTRQFAPGAERSRIQATG